MSSNPYQSPQFANQTVLPGTPFQLASRLSRLAATIVDGLIIASVYFIIVFLVVLFAGFTILENVNTFLLQFVFAGFYIGTYLALNSYFLAESGQTIGKKALGIRIVRTDGEPATLGRIIGQRLLPIMLIGLIPCIGGIVGLVNVLMIFRESRKCLHDDLADTIVIKA